MAEKTTKQKQEEEEVKTFTVPFDLGKIKESITINTDNYRKTSQEKMISKAINMHLKGNILEAKNYYKDCIHQGIKDFRIFCNYGVILKEIGNFKDAEVFTNKAIKINPNSPEANLNMGGILTEL